MRCVVLEGDEGLLRLLLDRLAALPGLASCVLEESDGHPVLRFPRATMREVPSAIPPDLLVAPHGTALAAPVLLCGCDARHDPLTVARFAASACPGDDLPLLTPDSPDAWFLDVLERVFPVLPQRTAEECGRCGLDCRRLAERIVAGLASPADCRVLPGSEGLRVLSGGRELPLTEFPARIVEGTIRGLLSALRGYDGEVSTTVHLGPAKPGGDR